MEATQQQSQELAAQRQKRPRREIAPQEKVKAVLAIWTERRKASELCRDLGVNRIQLDRWEEQALEGMLQALERKSRRQEPELKMLGSHLERLLERKVPKRLESMAKLEERIGQIQVKAKERKEKESKQD